MVVEVQKQPDNGKHTLHDPSSLYKRCQQAMLSFQSWGGHLRESNWVVKALRVGDTRHWLDLKIWSELKLPRCHGIIILTILITISNITSRQESKVPGWCKIVLLSCPGGGIFLWWYSLLSFIVQMVSSVMLNIGWRRESDSWFLCALVVTLAEASNILSACPLP